MATKEVVVERCRSCANIVPPGATACAICGHDFGQNRVLEHSARIPGLLFLLGIAAEALWAVAHVYLEFGPAPEGGLAQLAVFFFVFTIPLLVFWVLIPLAAFLGTANTHYLVTVVSGIVFYFAVFLLNRLTASSLGLLLLFAVVVLAALVIVWVVIPLLRSVAGRLRYRPS